MSKKKILNALLLACFFAMFIGMQIPAQAQQNVGIGITTPDASAILDLTATDKGMLVPRMNTAQRTAIATPATGLLVYDTDFAMFWYFDGTQWVPISAGMQGPTGPTGTAGVPGPIGPQGTQGPVGPTGVVGPTGEAGDHYATTSTDCITIGTGTFNITVATGLAYTAGQSIVVAYDVNNKLEGVVVSYDPMTGAMTVLIGTATGAGTYCSWGVNLNGTPGIQGPIGPAGPQGIAGVAGAQGPTGPTGATGLTGAVGPQGPIGPQGIQGVQGIQGPAGVAGAQGPTGATGIVSVVYSQTTEPYGSTTTRKSITVTTTSATDKVLLLGEFDYAKDGTTSYVTLGIWRGGVEIAETSIYSSSLADNTIFVQWVDVPGLGTFTYNLMDRSGSGAYDYIYGSMLTAIVFK